MKTTFLIYKDINAEKKELIVATHDEWDAIMKANKRLPPEQRRFFYKDCINEGSDGLDCMYIEVSLESYRALHSKQVLDERRRKENQKYQVLSMNEAIEGTDEYTCEDFLLDGIDYAEQAINDIRMKELRIELEQWEPYGNRLLDMYLYGKKRDCTKEMSMELGVSEQFFRRKKAEFEDIVKSFFGF